MKLFLRKLHHYLLTFNMFFFFLLLRPPLYFFSLKPSRYPGMLKLRLAWTFLTTFLSGIIFKFEYEVPVDWNKAYIICPNHTSNLDTSMICMLLRKNNFCFMGKDTLLNSLVTGIFFRTIDIPVNRDSKLSGFRAFKRAAEKLASGVNMVMFPEGGIADAYPPAIQEFKNGTFRLAIEQGVAILPVSSLNTWEVMWDDGAKFGSRPGICKVFVHQPIETIGLAATDADDLRDKVYAIMAKKFNKE